MLFPESAFPTPSQATVPLPLPLRIYFVCGASATGCAWRPEDNFGELVFLFLLWESLSQDSDSQGWGQVRPSG